MNVKKMLATFAVLALATAGTWGTAAAQIEKTPKRTVAGPIWCC